jgi:hypothetical protein
MWAVIFTQHSHTHTAQSRTLGAPPSRTGASLFLTIFAITPFGVVLRARALLRNRLPFASRSPRSPQIPGLRETLLHWDLGPMSPFKKSAISEPATVER